MKTCTSKSLVQQSLDSKSQTVHTHDDLVSELFKSDFARGFEQVFGTIEPDRTGCFNLDREKVYCCAGDGTSRSLLPWMMVRPNVIPVSREDSSLALFDDKTRG